MSSSVGAGRDCPVWGELQGKASAAGQDLQCFLDFPLQKVFTEEVGLDFFQVLSLSHTFTWIFTAAMKGTSLIQRSQVG